MKQKEIFLSLKKRNEISELFSKGEILYSKNFMVRYLSKNKEAALPFGVLWTVPRKMKRAVDRNRLRRVMKAALYQAFCEIKPNLLPGSATYHMAILPKREFEVLPHHERVSEMKKTLGRLGFAPGDSCGR